MRGRMLELPLKPLLHIAFVIAMCFIFCRLTNNLFTFINLNFFKTLVLRTFSKLNGNEKLREFVFFESDRRPPMKRQSMLRLLIQFTYETFFYSCGLNSPITLTSTQRCPPNIRQLPLRVKFPIVILPNISITLTALLQVLSFFLKLI